MPMITMQKAKSPSYVTIAPPPFVREWPTACRLRQCPLLFYQMRKKMARRSVWSGRTGSFHHASRLGLALGRNIFGSGASSGLLGFTPTTGEKPRSAHWQSSDPSLGTVRSQQKSFPAKELWRGVKRSERGAGKNLLKIFPRKKPSPGRILPCQKERRSAMASSGSKTVREVTSSRAARI